MMVGVFPVLFFGWKLVKKPRWLMPEEVDLITGVEIEENTRYFAPEPSKQVIFSLA